MHDEGHMGFSLWHSHENQPTLPGLQPQDHSAHPVASFSSLDFHPPPPNGSWFSLWLILEVFIKGKCLVFPQKKNSPGAVSQSLRESHVPRDPPQNPVGLYPGTWQNQRACGVLLSTLIWCPKVSSGFHSPGYTHACLLQGIFRFQQAGKKTTSHKNPKMNSRKGKILILTLSPSYQVISAGDRYCRSISGRQSSFELLAWLH